MAETRVKNRLRGGARQGEKVDHPRNALIPCGHFVCDDCVKNLRKWNIILKVTDVAEELCFSAFHRKNGCGGSKSDN